MTTEVQNTISGIRLKELHEIVRSGQYEDLVALAADKVGRDISAYILMSVRKGMSYDRMRIRWELRDIEPMPYSRTRFYVKRRLFFRYLDDELKDMQIRNCMG